MSEAVPLCCRNLRFGYTSETVIDGLSLELKPALVTGIIGPNGGGKTTLFRLLSGYLEPRSGTVELYGKPLKSYSDRDRARLLALLPQELGINFPFSVREVVAMGRTAHLGRFEACGKDDREAVESALAEMELTRLAGRRFSALSGGEKRRVFIAAALAQNSRVLLLDEPTAALDMGHAAHLMRHLRQLAHEKSLTVAVVSHDIELLGRFADRLLIFRAGNIIADGSCREIINRETVAAAYGIEVEIVQGRYGENLISYR